MGIPPQVSPGKDSDGNCRQTRPKAAEPATSDILRFQSGCFSFITDLGEQMAGTGVPGCAEGLLKPAFKADRPEQVAPASPPEGEEGVYFFFP